MLFDSLNPKFFSLLSCPNQDIYVDCLSKLHTIALEQKDNYITREIAEAVIGENAAEMLRKFVECGWMRRDYNDMRTEDIFMFSSFAIDILNLIHNYKTNDIVSTGEHWSSIMNSLNNVETSPYYSIVHARQQALELSSEYTKVDNMIKSQMDDLLKEDGNVYENIDNMNEEYLNGKIHKLYEESLNPLNIRAGKRKVIKLRIDDEIRRRFILSHPSKDKEEAERQFDDDFDKINMVLENCEGRMRSLETMVGKYYASAKRHIELFCDTDMTNIVNDVIANLENTEIQNLFSRENTASAKIIILKERKESIQEEIPDAIEVNASQKEDDRAKTFEKIMAQIKEEGKVTFSDSKYTWDEFHDMVKIALYRHNAPYNLFFTGKHVDGDASYPEFFVEAKEKEDEV